MGQGNSSFEEEEDDVGLPEFLETNKFGYRVLALQVNSPACNEGIVPFLDFIVEADGYPLTEEDGSFVKIIREFENKPLTIGIYNCKCKSFRRRTFVPRTGWGGDGLLGLTIKFDTYEEAEDHVLHVLDVKENSPAALAGIEPFTDFILGTPHAVFNELDEFYDLVTEVANENDLGDRRGIDIFVYSTRTDMVRRLVIEPRNNWGGEGLLGCGIGHGYLHRLPKSSLSTVGLARKEDFIPLPETPLNTKSKDSSFSEATDSQQSQLTGALTSAPVTDGDCLEGNSNSDKVDRSRLPQDGSCYIKPEAGEMNDQLSTCQVVEDDGAQKESSLVVGHEDLEEEEEEEEYYGGPKIVETASLGKGTLCGMKANKGVIALDWNLSNGATVLAFLHPSHFSVVRPTKAKEIEREAVPQPLLEENTSDGAKVIKVDLSPNNQH